MKKLLLAVLIIAICASMIAVAGCAGSAKPAAGSGSKSALPPPPPGTERLTLANAGLAMYKFELPAGQTWGNYNKLTVDYMVDEVNITKNIRSGCMRLYGNYVEKDFIDDWGTKTVSLSTDAMFANKIIDNAGVSWGTLGAVANEWFTYTYDLTGARAHGQFKKENLPASNATGPFFLALGITSQDEGRINAITQLVKNVTLHHATNPSLNVVTFDSGFKGNTSAAYYANNVTRELGPAE